MCLIISSVLISTNYLVINCLEVVRRHFWGLPAPEERSSYPLQTFL